MKMETIKARATFVRHARRSAILRYTNFKIIFDIEHGNPITPISADDNQVRLSQVSGLGQFRFGGQVRLVCQGRLDWIWLGQCIKLGLLGWLRLGYVELELLSRCLYNCNLYCKQRIILWLIAFKYVWNCSAIKMSGMCNMYNRVEPYSPTFVFNFV